MPKTAVADILAKAVKSGIAPLLKNGGYLRNGTHYYRSEPGVLKILNVQSSQWNSAQHGRFTINLGVHLEALADLHLPMPDPPREEYCLLRERIGILLPEARDYWWDVTPSTDSAVLADQLQRVCEEYALPWLEKHGNTHSVAEELERKRQDRDAGMAWLLLGDVPRATRIIRRCLQQRSEQLAEYSDMDALKTRFPKANPAQLEKTAIGERARIQRFIHDLRSWAKQHNLEIE